MQRERAVAASYVQDVLRFRVLDELFHRFDAKLYVISGLCKVPLRLLEGPFNPIFVGADHHFYQLRGFAGEKGSALASVLLAGPKGNRTNRYAWSEKSSSDR